MILDIEAIELQKLANLIEANHGTAIDLSADRVNGAFAENTLDGRNRADFGYFTNKQVPHYNIEEKAHN